MDTTTTISPGANLQQQQHQPIPGVASASASNLNNMNNRLSAAYLNEWALLNDAQRRHEELIEQMRQKIEAVGAQFEIILATARTVEVKTLNDMLEQLENLLKINMVRILFRISVK